MKRLDFYIRTQLNMAAVELVLLGTAGIVTFLALLNGRFSSPHLVLLVLWPVCTVLSVGLSIYALRKIFCTSVYGQTSALYQSLPVSPGMQFTSKIFAAGCVLLPAVTVVFWTPISCIGSVLFGTGQVRMILANVLVSLGYHQTETPLFVMLALFAAVLGCFTMAAVVQFVTAAYQSLTNRPGKLAAGIVRMILAVLGVLFLNLLPYWLLISSGFGGEIGGGEELAHPAMMPAAGILLNMGVLLAAGRSSVRTAER